jgi:hypothetical protein
MWKFTAFLWAILITPAFSATHKVPADDPIATIEISDKWQTKQLGEGIEATSPDGGVSFLIMPVEGRKVAESMSEAMRYLRGKNGITVKSDSVQREQGKLNDMETRKFSWQGKDMKGGDVEIRFTIVSIVQNKRLLVAYWGSPEAEKKRATELNKILQSIKKP